LINWALLAETSKKLFILFVFTLYVGLRGVILIKKTDGSKYFFKTIGSSSLFLSKAKFSVIFRSPFMTRNSAPGGSVYYIGAHLDRDGYNRIFRQITLETDVTRCPFGTVKGVETVTRTDFSSTYIFVMNHLDTPAYISLDKEYMEILGEKNISEVLRLGPYGVAVLTDKV